MTTDSSKGTTRLRFTVQRLLLSWTQFVDSSEPPRGWGEARMTQDIDLSLLSGFGDEATYIDELLSAFPPRIPDARTFAVTNRVLLLSASNGVSMDISLAALPFEEQMVGRATPFAYAPDCSLITCSAEDLVVLKAFADRHLDRADVEGIVARRREELDAAYITDQLRPLCELKEAPEIVRKVEGLLDEPGGPEGL